MTSKESDKLIETFINDKSVFKQNEQTILKILQEVRKQQVGSLIKNIAWIIGLIIIAYLMYRK